MVTISITAARCIALHGERYRDADSVSIADCRSPCNATCSRNGNRPLHDYL